MKKTVLIIISLFISFIGYSQTFNASDNNNNTLQFNITSSASVEVKDYISGGTDIDIPATISNNGTTYNVTGIAPVAFLNNGITSIIIPDSVTSIGAGAFQNNMLTSAIIPSNVTSLGINAFSNNQLTSISIVGNITSIGNYTFHGNQLSSITIPDSVTSIGSFAFLNNQLTSVTIPSNVTSIGDFAFQGNPLTCVVSEATTPPTITTSTSSGYDTFVSNGDRSNIDLSVPTGTASTYIASGWTSFNSVSEGLTNTFVADHITYAINSNPNNEVTITDYNTAGGTVVNIPATVSNACTLYSVTYISVNAFNNKGLTSVTIPNSIIGILPSAFGNNALTSITIPTSVTSIGASAFSNNQLATVSIPSSITTISSSLFSSNQLTNVNIPDTVTSIDQNAFASNLLQNVTIGNSVTTIGNQAFMNNALPSVVIPNNVTSIGVNCFANNQLTSATISSNITNIPNLAFRNNLLTSVTIPNNVTSIGANAFSYNQLTSIIIPNNVTSIGNSAFSNNQLTNLVIGNSVSSIGISAFGNNNLTAVVFPSSVTNIGILAFGFNPSLTSVTAHGMTPPTISTGGSQDTFGNYVLRSNMDLHIPPGTTNAYVTDAGALWTGFNSVTEDATLSVEDIDLTKNVFLITTTNTLKIVAPNNARLKNYTLYNVSGIAVASDSKNEITTSSLANGVYVLKLNFHEGTAIKKVIIN